MINRRARKQTKNTHAELQSTANTCNPCRNLPMGFLPQLIKDVAAELKPCPFCGEEPVIVNINEFFHVECTACGARAREVHKDKFLAIKFWEHRI